LTFATPSPAPCQQSLSASTAPGASKAALKSAAAKEVEKLQGVKMSQYLFVVSASVSPEAEQEILNELAVLDSTDNQVWH
jgi:hypothetical protein